MTDRINSEAAKLAGEILNGATRALSRGLTHAECGGKYSEALMDHLYVHTGRAHVVGITGNPGSGKSTLTAALAREAASKGFSVAVIAIDPSSPFSGGSILGDRIRMNDVAAESGVFVRSMAAHGSVGGLCPPVADCIDMMDAAGRNLIFVETVGVGQDEVEIMEVAHTVVVLSVPGLGDDIQMLKAGVLEIAQIHVVNKADREGADRVLADLRTMLTISSPSRAWVPPIVPCVAIRGQGIPALFGVLLDHWAALKDSGELDRQRKRIAKARVYRIARDLLMQGPPWRDSSSDELIDRVVRRQLAPHPCARALLARWVKEDKEMQ